MKKTWLSEIGRQARWRKAQSSFEKEHQKKPKMHDFGNGCADMS